MLDRNKNIYKYLLPNLLDVQRASYCWFLEKGLLQELENFTAIRDYLGELELSLSAKQYKIKRPKHSLAEAKRRDTTYSIRIYIIAKLDYLVTSESKKGEVFLGDIPLMTNDGTFLVNGIERIRYTTSHPRDMTKDLLECYKNSKKLMPLVHLPIQSGSNKILKLMNVTF